MPSTLHLFTSVLLLFHHHISAITPPHKFQEAPAFLNGKECNNNNNNKANNIHIAMTLDLTYLCGSIAGVLSIVQHVTCLENIIFHFITTQHMSSHLGRTMLSTFPYLKFHLHFFSIGLVKDMISTSVRRALDQPLNYARIYLSHLLSSYVNRVIYFDSDLIVVDDVVKLWEIDLNDHVVGAPEYCHANFTLYFTAKFWSNPYFSGVFKTGANNDINVLDNSSLFDDLLDNLAPVVPYMVNGVEYRNGYYLADGIYPEWASFVKSFTVATDLKHTYFKQRQESAWKDVERAFGVLQGRWGLIQQPARAYEVNTLRRIMYAGIIKHNMILEDQNMSIVDLNHVYSNPTRTKQRMWIDRCETQRRKAKELRDRDTHISLQQKLMNHMWREVEEASEEG
nr:probable galacturonosyltransferase-like 3 [Tanacetum cinerariifolium]